MSLPGLPPARRAVLPVPPGGAAAARAAGRRRRASVLGGAAVALALAAGTTVLLPDRGPAQTLDPAAPGHPERGPGRSSDASTGVPGRLSGVVSDRDGRALARIAVLPTDLGNVLTRTDAQGRYSVPCGTDLLLAAYAPAPAGVPVRERSPGAADVAWRQVGTSGRCGERIDVVLPPGGAVEGRGAPGSEVLLSRALGSSDRVLRRGPVFAARVRRDGRWRVAGLDTGRYLLPDGRPVDVKEGRTSTLP